MTRSGEFPKLAIRGTRYVIAALLAVTLIAPAFAQRGDREQRRESRFTVMPYQSTVYDYETDAERARRFEEWQRRCAPTIVTDAEGLRSYHYAQPDCDLQEMTK